MASLRSQLPDLEAVEPISPVMSDLGILYGTRVLDPTCLYLIFVFLGGASTIPTGPSLKLVQALTTKTFGEQKEQSILNQVILQ